MLARWKLGRVLKTLERGHGPGRGKKMSRTETSFRTYLKDVLHLDKSRAVEAQRIGAMPDKELMATFKEASKPS
jgi:hypothetical protein